MEQMEMQLRAMALDLASKSIPQGGDIIAQAKIILQFLKGE